MNNYGFAVDLGTTTIDCCLVKKDDKSVISSFSFANPQSLYGSDIMNRIMTIKRDSSKLSVLKKMVVDGLLHAFQVMLEDGSLVYDSIGEICICGNTTMNSILLGLDVSSLGEAPFLSSLKDGQIIDANVLFDSDLFSCFVYVSGCAGAFIGGDILSGLYYIDKKFEISSNSLLLDFGTNGEMVLFANDKWYGAATACGPAFEGCTRKQKIYGASTIEAIALGVMTNKIVANGSLKDDSIRELTISGVKLDSNILQQILLAKAAIVAGIYSLCDVANIEVTSLDTIYLAGGFGFYLDIEHAITIGLLPACFKDKVQVVGNSSLLGAKELLFVEDKNKYMHNKDIQILNFAMLEGYQDLFVSNMFYKKV